MASKHFIIVGAGLGGLATALRLAHRGHKVTVFEKLDKVGGRNRPISVGSAEFDVGPTLMMMLDPFKKLFADVGERLEDHLELELCDPSYRVFFGDGKRLEGTPNVARMLQQIEDLAGLEEAAKYPHFLGRLGDLYHASVPNFVRNNYFSPWSYLAPAQVFRVFRHKMLSNLWSQVSKAFKHPHLRQLFSFQTMYLGLSPFESPFVYATLTYMEYGEGIWYPKGGIHRIAEAIAELAIKKGAEIRLESAVRAVRGKTVVMESGEEHTADAVIINADLPYAEEKLMGVPKGKAITGKPRAYSCSTYMLYIEYAGELPQLLHHNVFFGKDFKDNLEDIFNNHKLPADPAFYAAVSKRSDPNKAPEGIENLYLLIPCPNLDMPWGPEAEKDLRDKVFNRLGEEIGFKQESIRSVKEYTPEDWARDLNLDKGAAFGISHHFLQSAFFRPGNRSRRFPNNYFVGASSNPGNGMPMVLIGAELLEQRLIHDGLIKK